MNSQLEIKLATKITDTPETDAMEYYDAMCDPDRVVEADFARKLERERDAAQKAMVDARDILLDAMPDANAPTKILAEMIVAERDKYQESADALVDRLGATQERMINAERERDEAREHVANLEVSLTAAIRSANMCQDEAEKATAGKERLERERDEAQETIATMEIRHAAVMLHTQSIVDDANQCREQRDRLAAAIRERDEAQERADTMFAKHVDILDQARRERDEWKAKYIQQNKDLGIEMMDPNGTIWDYAKKLQKDIAAINDRRDNFEERLRVELGGHPDSELWGETGLIAATMRCVDALDVVTEQRDDAREQLRKAQVENDHNWQAIEMYEAERALADRLALALKMTRWDSPVTCKKALDAWKEVRSES